MNPLDLIRQVEREIIEIKEDPSVSSSEKERCLKIVGDIKNAKSEHEARKLVPKLQNSLKNVSAIGNNHLLKVTRFTEAFLDTLSEERTKVLSKGDKQAIDFVSKEVLQLVKNGKEQEIKAAAKEIFAKRNSWQESTLGLQKTFSKGSTAVYYDNEKNLVFLEIAGKKINFDTLEEA